MNRKEYESKWVWIISRHTRSSVYQLYSRIRMKTKFILIKLFTKLSVIGVKTDLLVNKTIYENFLKVWVTGAGVGHN